MIVYVTQDSEGEVIGVSSDLRNVQTGKANGLRHGTFALDGMKKVGPNDRPFVVYFNQANQDKPQAWPISEGFPEESGPVALYSGIEFVVYAANAAEAIAKVFGMLHFDSWDIAFSEWEQMQ